MLGTLLFVFFSFCVKKAWVEEMLYWISAWRQKRVLSDVTPGSTNCASSWRNYAWGLLRHKGGMHTGCAGPVAPFCSVDIAGTACNEARTKTRAESNQKKRKLRQQSRLQKLRFYWIDSLYKFHLKNSNISICFRCGNGERVQLETRKVVWLPTLSRFLKVRCCSLVAKLRAMRHNVIIC